MGLVCSRRTRFEAAAEENDDANDSIEELGEEELGEPDLRQPTMSIGSADSDPTTPLTPSQAQLALTNTDEECATAPPQVGSERDDAESLDTDNSDTEWRAGAVPKRPRWGPNGQCYTPRGRNFRPQTTSSELAKLDEEEAAKKPES